MWPITVTFSYCIRVHWFIYFVFTYTVLLTVYYIQLNNFVRGIQGGGLTSEGLYYIYMVEAVAPPTPHCADSEKRRGEVGSLPPLFTFKGTVATHRRFHVILRTRIYETRIKTYATLIYLSTLHTIYILLELYTLIKLGH